MCVTRTESAKRPVTAEPSSAAVAMLRFEQLERLVHSKPSHQSLQADASCRNTYLNGVWELLVVVAEDVFSYYLRHKEALRML